MARSAELDHIKEKMSDVSILIDIAEERYLNARNLADQARIRKEAAKKARDRAQAEKNQEIERLRQEEGAFSGDLWTEFYDFQKEINVQIKPLKEEAGAETRKMRDCYARANYARDQGDKKIAEEQSKEGNTHKYIRNDLNGQISELIGEIMVKKAETEELTAGLDEQVYREKKQHFMAAERDFSEIKAEFRLQIAEVQYYKDELISLRKELKDLQIEFNNKLADFREQQMTERDLAIHNAGIEWSYISDAVVVSKANGIKHVYYGGEDKGSGEGHGHVVLNKDDEIIYNRGVNEAHGSHNFVK